jgi:hypothetical protein
MYRTNNTGNEKMMNQFGILLKREMTWCESGAEEAEEYI